MSYAAAAVRHARVAHRAPSRGTHPLQVRLTGGMTIELSAHSPADKDDRVILVMQVEKLSGR
jgi:hypothetical protein